MYCRSRPLYLCTVVVIRIAVSTVVDHRRPSTVVDHHRLSTVSSLPWPWYHLTHFLTQISSFPFFHCFLLIFSFFLIALFVLLMNIIMAILNSSPSSSFHSSCGCGGGGGGGGGSYLLWLFIDGDWNLTSWHSRWRQPQVCQIYVRKQQTLHCTAAVVAKTILLLLVVTGEWWHLDSHWLMLPPWRICFPISLPTPSPPFPLHLVLVVVLIPSIKK